MAYSIELLSEDNADQWEGFNNQFEEGTLFHSLRWKQVLEDVFHPKLRYYLILNDREIVGISPWAEQSALNFQGLVSIPHSEYNGIMLGDTLNADHFNEILSLFAKKYSFLHFNTCNPALLDEIGFTHVPGEDTGHMVTNLRVSPPDAIWAGLSKNVRFAIRTFEKDGFEVSEISRPGDLDDFYRYYVGNMTHINGKILPLAFFERLLERFPDEVRVTALSRDGLFAAGSLALLDPARKIFYGNYLAINRDLPNRYTPSYYIMWESINWAWKNGYEKLSSGRQKLEPGNPRFRYKAKFGAEHLPVHSNLVLLSKPMLVSYKIREMLLMNRGA
jgi:hypothetical protein